MRLTARHLRRLNACSTKRFSAVFPRGAPLTQRSVRLAKDAGLDIRWLRAAIRQPTSTCPGPCAICAAEKRAHAWLVKSGLAAGLKRILKGVR